DAASALLEPGKTIEQQFGGGESRDYRFALKTGEYARLLIDQRSINIAVECFGPDGGKLFAADSYVVGDTEIAQLIAETSGNYRIRITAPDKTAPVGRYNISLSQVETAADRHRSLVAAARAYGEATARTSAPGRESVLASVAKFEEALTHWRAAHDL